jgi:hypothetical protein
VVIPDYHHWATTRASTRLEIGDQANFVFPYDDRSFLKEDFCQVGVADGFGRIHWRSRKELRDARQKYKRDFVSEHSPA